MNEPKLPQGAEVTIIDAMEMYKKFRTLDEPKYNLKDIASMAVEELPILDDVPVCPLLMAAYCGMTAEEAAEFAEDYSEWKEKNNAGNFS